MAHTYVQFSSLFSVVYYHCSEASFFMVLWMHVLDMPCQIAFFWQSFHLTGPLGRLGLGVAMSAVCVFVCVSIPSPWDSPRGANEVPGEQSCLPPWHQYPEKMLCLTIGPQSTWSGPVSHCVSRMRDLQNDFFSNNIKLPISLFDTFLSISDLVSSALLLVSSSSDSLSSSFFLVYSDLESTDSFVVLSYSLCRYALCYLDFSSNLKLHRHSKHLYCPNVLMFWLGLGINPTLSSVRFVTLYKFFFSFSLLISFYVILGPFPPPPPPKRQ
jgi:hypothetical protein